MLQIIALDAYFDKAMTGNLQAAMLSKDSSFTSVVQQAASQLDIQLVEMEDVLRYVDLVSQEPFDLLLLDCDGLAAGENPVSTLRKNSANRDAVFMIAGTKNASAMSSCGASVILPKPLTTEMAQRYLREAVQVMQERRRQYDRHALEVDVLVACDRQNWGLSAKSLTLGEGGIGLQLPQRIDLGSEEEVRVSFQLPESSGRLEIAANLAWINNDMQAGFRFKPLTTTNSAKLSAWLNQHAAPQPPGASRKEIVESWLAKHGSATDTVVISSALRNQILPKKSLPPSPVSMAAPETPAQAPETQNKALTRTIWYIVGSFLLGIVAGMALLRIYHLL